MHTYTVYLCIYLALVCNIMVGHDAYVIVPVADLVGNPLPSHDTYNGIPLSGDHTACRRIHQILYHERVRVIATCNDQVQIELPNVFYRPCGTTTTLSTFWTLKKYLLPVNAIHGDTQQLPHPTPYKECTTVRSPQTTTITLTHPYYDPTTQLTFSAGTQFIPVDQQTIHKKNIMVYVLDHKNHVIIRTKLPAKLCLNSDAYTKKQRIDLFIDLIRSWIRSTPAKSSIPYVWGGTSIVNTVKGHYRLRHHKSSGRWYTLEGDTQTIKTGCDCSGLIYRAAQICGIHYFFKNSYTARCYLKPVGKDVPLAPGDIIWVPGHVMIVADLHKNTLFEARSYDHGYGKLQEIRLEKVFKGIKTYQDLLTAYEKKLPLLRIDRFGVTKDTFKEFVILSLASSWDLVY